MYNAKSILPTITELYKDGANKRQEIMFQKKENITDLEIKLKDMLWNVTNKMVPDTSICNRDSKRYNILMKSLADHRNNEASLIKDCVSECKMGK